MKTKYQRLKLIYLRLKNMNMFKRKIFCISIQRTGTTSVGHFLSDHGMDVARWKDSRKNEWSYKWLTGDLESIYKSFTFRSYQAFEDDPWWLPDHYRILFHRFKNAKFILFTRNSEKWFESMMKHSGGKTLGNTYRHCKVYRRLDDYYQYLDEHPAAKPSQKEIDNLLSLESKKDHYIKIYEEHNNEVIRYFKEHAPDRLFIGQLEDPEKWRKLGEFLKIPVDPNYNTHVTNYNTHVNKSK